jgi:cytochrome P450/deferrochelatase/peroxidase EfeB/uncharacterized membrane protein YeaQ/YmgE (transglycosylase-associated protein family)
MAWLKYFEKITAAQSSDSQRPPGPRPPFDFASLGSRNPIARWFSRFLLRRVLPALTALLRLLWPNPRFGRLVIVTRRRDVEEVLGDMTRFPVVYALEMTELGGGTNNVLGLDGEPHDVLAAQLRRAIRPEDLDRVAQWVGEDADALLDAGGGRIDVMRDLVTRTATESACRLFGVTAHDPDQFAEWTMAVSNQLFGDFFGDPNIRTQAQTGAAHLRAAIDDAIARVENNNLRNPDSGRERATLIDRLVTDMAMPPDQVRATILGLLTAFIPTNTLAGGNMLEVLFSNRRLLGEAQAAARAGDRARLRTVLLEAGRVNPALSPGLWRHVPADAPESEIGGGRRGTRRVRPGDLILACIPSALREGGRFGGQAWLMFGHGPHVCLGAELALAHLVSVFGTLLAREDLSRAPGRRGRMFRTGPFPTRLDMTYRADAGRRALMVLTFDVRKHVPRKDVEAALDALGNPACDQVRDSFDATGRVQFASVSVIERAPGADDSVMILELRGDGDDAALLRLVAKRCFAWLAPLMAFCSADGKPPADPAALAAALLKGHRPLHRWPWGSTGLHFDGLGELSVADIARQEHVALFATEVVEDALSRDLGLSTRAMDLLLRTRRMVKRDSFHALRCRSRELMRTAPARTSILKPSRKRLAIADWTPPTSIYGPLPRMLLARDNRLLLLVLLGLIGALVAGLIVWLVPAGLTWPLRVLAIAACLIGGVLLFLLKAALLAGVLWALIRWREKREPSDDSPPSLDHVAKVSEREDAPGHAQNHIIAVMPFKKGLIRRLSFAFVMWGIKQSVLYWFRPGFVVTMGTIHKASWFRVPSTNQFVFFSNFDGSWESYLEDFITRANEGQSAAWSHGVGFPPTQSLIRGGAADGDRFKRWVRRQQRPSRCWYSRFPNLTAQQIRRNAMIEDGLARAVTDTDARRWLSHFGSAQRERDELETQEAQTLIFSGFPKQLEATALFVRLPEEPKAVAAWLRAITGLRAQPGSAFMGPPQRWLVPGRDGAEEIQLPLEARVRFGEQAIAGGGAALGLTAFGLERAGLSEECGLHALSAPFRMTMAARARMLGDAPGGHSAWRFSDDPLHSRGAHALLMLYGQESGLTHAELVDGHDQLIQHFDGDVVQTVPCTPVGGRLDQEHFGFRDGVSQPVIRGTRRKSRPVPERDVVAAGEFLLGYRNVQGFVPPPITVGSEHDPANDLPTPAAADSNRYPYFGSRGESIHARDFGRNGCFIAIRQLDQDPQGFQDQLVHTAARLKDDYPGLAELAGGAVSAEWLGAKIIGRWRDGSPLVGNADVPARRSERRPAPNDFAYGVDDPRGLACPLGAHIRRANPRDSLEPGDRDEQSITNRHRLLRRGRTYDYEADGAGTGRRTGLLFIALCADLERQFEFVQRSWLNATSFHGLVEERDPLLGGGADGKAGQKAAAARPEGFTIPTAVGPLRVASLQSYVTLRGGGYFFLPSRSALAFLINRSVRLTRQNP